MGQKSGPAKEPAEQVIREIRRSTRRQFSAEEKIRIVLSGLRGEDSIAELCRREGIVQNLYYRWSKEFRETRLENQSARSPPERRRQLRQLQSKPIAEAWPLGPSRPRACFPENPSSPKPSAICGALDRVGALLRRRPPGTR